MRSRPWIPVWVLVGVAALLALSLWQRWRMLSASPFPLGVDGYFYPIQLRALLERGELAYPASPLAFYLIAPFAAATDPITGAKLGAAVWGAAIAIPAYGVAARLGGGRGAGLIAAALATTSVGSAYLTVEFVKNGVGLAVALAALWAVLAACDRPSRAPIGEASSGGVGPATAGPGRVPRLAAGWIAGAIAGLIAAWLTHKMAAALVVLAGVPAVLAAATAHGWLRGRRLIYAVAGLVGAGAAALAIGAASPRRFLTLDDAALLGGLLSATPRWSDPALVFAGGELAMGHDALIGLGTAIAAAVALVLERRALRASGAPARISASARAAAWPILGLAIAIGLPLLDVADRDGLGFRLRIAAFVPAALSAAVLAGAALRRLPCRDLVLAALATGLVALRLPGERLEGQIVTHPALVSAAQALRGRVPPGATLIVPERHIAFLVAWYTGAPIAIRPGRVPRDRRYRLLPLHFIRADSALDRQLLAARAEPSLISPLGVHPSHPNGLVLVAEPTWDWIVERLPAAERARCRRWPTI